MVHRIAPARETFPDRISFKAPSFPRPAKALMESHPMYACIPIRKLQTPSRRPWRRLLLSMYLTRFLVPHFWNRGHDIPAENLHIVVVGCYYNSSVAFCCGMSCMQHDSCISLVLVSLHACYICPLILADVKTSSVSSSLRCLTI